MDLSFALDPNILSNSSHIIFAQVHGKEF